MSVVKQDIDELADEYVLGLLDAADHARVDMEIETDAALRAAVAASRDRFLALDLLAKPAAEPEGLWGRIAATLEDPKAGKPVVAAQDVPQATIYPANDNGSAGWRRAALSGIAASLLLAVGLGWSLLSQPEPRVVAVLLDTAGEPQAIVEDFGNASARVMPLVDFKVPEGRIMQVWTLPSKDLGPVSLGLLPRSENMVLNGPALPPPQEAQLYEITIEQAGGSPTGRPTGPILVKGFAKMPR
ncbi:anti-sigma factor domain-containing protein [Rhizobium sp. PL01]|uniref:anti-sigma factor n=1 Tax=Rhizobium sp. PL01 TaxID=3085631 RepID=UPI002980EBDE|nr:anti-sigma factor [Rhizobium sp. PL01]MDW5316620.1 anti-sigma factor [Rhizobium sp. PL01]